MPSKIVNLNRKDAKIAKAFPREILAFFAVRFDYGPKPRMDFVKDE